MNKKRLISGLLAGVLALALAAPMAVPAKAAGQSSFLDIQDSNTAVNADILRLMGVVTGTGGNRFNPSSQLTRAQFCAMVVNFMQHGEEVAIHATRTIFSDVPGSHWARGYVNLASSLTVKESEEKSVPLITGVGDGTFLPDKAISQAEAVTILIRMLEYTSSQTGVLWPQSYMNLADSIGLRDGLPQDYNQPLTRAQAAQLFVNALTCKTAGGKEYYTTLGEPKEGTVVLAVNVATDTGEGMGAVRTSSGTYLPKAEDVAPTALQGRRGTLILDENQEIVTFVPDDTTPVTITLNGDAQPGFVKGGGQQYTISGDTKVYTSEEPEGKSYLDCYSTLYSGTQLTLFTQRGKVVAIYAVGATTTASTEAVVVMGNATVATFHQLTGGATNFNIVKNRQPIKLSDIQPYDVVTYDELSNTLIVSDLRITCTYQDAKPTVNAPKTITSLGNEFTVLESAWNTTKDFTLGDTVSLLLTADGKVAGMAKSGMETRSTAVGIVEGGAAKIFLPNGGTMDLKGTVNNAESVEGQLVIFSMGRETLNTSRLSENRVPGDFHVDEMTLGSVKVLNSVRVFEKVTTSGLVEINLNDLAMSSIPANQIAGYHLNSAGMVDYLILNNVTGNAYEYGMMSGVSLDDDDSTKTQWTLLRGVSGNLKFGEKAGYSGRTGDIVGIVTYKSQSGELFIRDVLQLTKMVGVTEKDFFVSQGNVYVTVGGQNYRVADDVECYGGMSGDRTNPGNWFAQSDTIDRVNAMKAYADTMSIYIDPIGKQVRVITAG